ncbi:MAG: DNA polymerase III subunit delta [Lachnospiraceae bacterium]|nr:DNA polymerase III subunit delta [Lachnospiraceae bacterium]
MHTLNQHIREQTFQPVYLLCGDEPFLKNSYKKRLKEAAVGDDGMNFARFEGKALEVEALIRLADTMPFFAPRRLILIEDSGYFKGAPEALVKYLPQMPDTTCLVFVESVVDKRGKLYKKVKELGYIAELGRQDGAQLAKWAGGILGKEGKKITRQTMEYFLAMVGDDMENIRTELEKLVSYTWGREVVTDQDVEAVCTVRISNRIFEMVAAIANRQGKKAMELYEGLLALKEPPMRILFLIARQFNQILQVKELAGQGMDRNAIASKLKIQPFIVGKATAQARQFSHSQILSYVNLCVEAEEAVKSGKLEGRIAVEMLIAKEY